MSVPERPWRVTADGLGLAVRLTPRGGRDAIEGVAQRADGHCVLEVRVRAAPSAGEANTALIRLLAETLGVPARDIDLVAGAAARLKRLRIAGNGAVLAQTLEKKLAPLERAGA